MSFNRVTSLYLTAIFTGERIANGKTLAPHGWLCYYKAH